MSRIGAAAIKPSRRDFLISSSLAAGGLLIHGRFALAESSPSVAVSTSEYALNAWVRIARDNTITIISSQAEMGQGIQTILPAVLAVELGADWRRVRLGNAPAHPAYRNPRINWQFTGNSESTTAFFDLMRRMGASARERLKAAAAARWNVDPASCHTEAATVVHAATGCKATFGALAQSAATIREPENPRLNPLWSFATISVQRSFGSRTSSLTKTVPRP